MPSEAKDANQALAEQLTKILKARTKRAEIKEQIAALTLEEKDQTKIVTDAIASMKDTLTANQIPGDGVFMFDGRFFRYHTTGYDLNVAEVNPLSLDVDEPD